MAPDIETPVTFKPVLILRDGAEIIPESQGHGKACRVKKIEQAQISGLDRLFQAKAAGLVERDRREGKIFVAGTGYGTKAERPAGRGGAPDLQLRTAGGGREGGG